MNPALLATFDWLKSQGLPPLPVAPAQDPMRYPAHARDGSLKRDKDGVLVPAFTGKNPSYVDSRGIPHLIRHTQYQNRMPTQAELQIWFANPDNGIGTLGGWQNIVWVDVDVKQFESQQACDQRIADWLGQYPLLQQTFTEPTHSGGWRCESTKKRSPISRWMGWVVSTWGRLLARGALQCSRRRLSGGGMSTSMCSGYRRFG